MLPILDPSRPFYQKLAFVLIIILAGGYLCIIGKEVLCPLIFGLLFALLLLPLANFMERKLRFSRGGASAISVILMILAVVVIFMVVGAQLSDLASDLPLLQQQVVTSLHNFQHWLTASLHINMEKQMTYIDSATEKLQTATPAVIGATVLSLSSVLLFLVFIILDTFFMLMYRRLLFHFLLDVFLEKNAHIVVEVMAKVQHIIRKYIVGLFFQMATVAVVCCTVFLLLGIKYAILLGLITALFNIVPYIGIFSALLLNVIITFATTGLATKVLLVIITVIIVHLLDSNVLLPLIVGSQVRINAFVTLVGVVLGERIWGITGMFLSIPIIAIAKIIFDRVETLKPWGSLMGDEKGEVEKDNKKRHRVLSKFKGKNQPPITESPG